MKKKNEFEFITELKIDFNDDFWEEELSKLKAEKEKEVERENATKLEFLNRQIDANMRGKNIKAIDKNLTDARKLFNALSFKIL